MSQDLSVPVQNFQSRRVSSDEVLESLATITWAITLPTYDLIHVSSTVQSLGDYTASDLLNHPHLWQSLVYPEDLDCVMQQLGQMKPGDRATIRCRFVQANQQVQSVVCQATVVCDADTNPVRVQGTLVLIPPEHSDSGVLASEAITGAIAPVAAHGEAQFRAIFEQASVGIAQIDNRGRYQLVNQCFCDMLGYSTAELLGKSFGDFTHPSDLSTDLACHHQLMCGRIDSFTQEKRYLCKNGQVRWVKMSVSAISVASPSLSVSQNERDRTDSCPYRGSTAIIWDIGDRKQTEQSLRQSQAMLQLVIDNIPQRIFWKDTHLVYLGCNQHQAESSGFSSPADIIGKTDFDLPWTPEQAQQYQTGDRHVIANNRAEYGVAETEVQPNGQPRHLEINKIPLRNPDGEVIGILGTVEDVTEKLQAQADLVQKNNELQAIFAAFPDLFFRIAADGTYLDCKARVDQDLIFPSEYLLGRRVQDVLPHPVGKGMLQGVQVTLRTGSLTVLEYTLVLSHGPQFFEARIVPFQADEVLILVRNQTRRKRAERALVQSEKRFQRLAENLPGVIYQYLHPSNLEDGEFLYVSPSIRRLYNLEPQQVIQTYTLCDIIHADDWPHVQESLRQAARSLSPWQAEWRVVTAHADDPKWIQAIARPEQQPDGRVLWDGILLDITERKRFETMLQTQAYREQALNQVIQAIRDSLDLRTIFSTAASQTAHLLSAVRVCIIRYAPKRQTWQFVMDYQPHLQDSNLVGTELQDSDRHLFARIKEGTSLRLTGQQLCRTLSQDCAGIATEAPGHWLIVPLIVASEPTSNLPFQHETSPLPDPPYIWGCLCIVSPHPNQRWQDSDYELAQVVANQLTIAIQQSELYHRIRLFNLQLEHQVQHRTIELQHALSIEEMLKRIVDNVRDSLDEEQILQTVVRELAETLVLDCCNTAFYDLTNRIAQIRQEYITTDISPLQGYAEPMASNREVYKQLLEGNTLHFSQMQPNLMRPNYRPTVLCCPIVSDGQVVGDLWLYRPQFAVFSDIEIRLVKQIVSQCAIAMRQAHLYQAAQAQVRELERLSHLKDDFLCTVSHELRTPVANIHMATQMLELFLSQNTTIEQPVAQYLKLLQDGAEQEMDLINDLLDLQHLNAGTRPLDLSEIHVPTWLPHLVESFELRTRALNQTLQLQASPSLPPIYSDRGGLQRILVELVNNACKYTPPGETITLLARQAANTMQFEVRNTGVAIPKDELPRIFDKFYRIPQTDRWQHGGTGLGLALVQELTHYLQGRVEVESDRNTTRFIVTLPIYHCAQEPCPLDI